MPAMELAGRIALVTGGAHRLGGALSLALAEAGADVLVHYHTAAAEAAALVTRIQGLGRRAVAVAADLTDATAAGWLIDQACQELGSLDVLVNSAALFERGSVQELSVAAWDRVMALNVRAPFLLARTAAPTLARRGGAIINIADLSAFQPWPSYPHHSVSKAALVHLTLVLARALAPQVRVNCIAPGTVLPHPGLAMDEPAAREPRVVARAGTPADVARALIYLLEEDFVTGETLIVDGGRLLL